MKSLIKVLLIPLFAVLFFTACGGGGGSDASFSNSQDKIALQSCETYIDIVSGDVVVQDANNTSIKTIFNTDGSKKVCVLSGSAYILRD